MSAVDPAGRDRRVLHGRTVFLSASIPDPGRYEGPFDALEITDAVVAAARAVITAGGVLATAAHPTIAPLLLYVANELPADPTSEVAVHVYQSRLFEDVLPSETRRLFETGAGQPHWTRAAENERPEPGRWNESLRIMRRQMLREQAPGAAVFIGGMQGILDEFDLFREMYPMSPTYPLARPGGEARHLVVRAEFAGRSTELGQMLATSDVYPAIFRRVVADFARWSA
jgi:hypothetical protein